MPFTLHSSYLLVCYERKKITHITTLRWVFQNRVDLCVPRAWGTPWLFLTVKSNYVETQENPILMDSAVVVRCQQRQPCSDSSFQKDFLNLFKVCWLTHSSMGFPLLSDSSSIFARMTSTQPIRLVQTSFLNRAVLYEHRHNIFSPVALCFMFG